MKNDKKANIGLMTALFLYQMIIDKAIQGPSRIDQRGQCPLYRPCFRSVRCALFCVCVCLASSDHKSIGCINFFSGVLGPLTTIAYNIRPNVYSLSLWHSATGLLKLQTDFLGVVIFLELSKAIVCFSCPSKY